MGGGGGEKSWGHGDLYITLNAQLELSRAPLPAGGWQDAFLLGLLPRIFTLSLTALFPCLSVPLFICPSTSYAGKDKNRLEYSPCRVIVDCLDISRHYFLLKGNIRDI